MSDVTLQPATRPFAATLSPPGSKSITNRALVLAALAAGQSALSNVLFADDTRVMLDCLARLGFKLDINEAAHTVAVSGGGGRIHSQSADLFCGNSGTTIRFLTALCCLGRGEFSLDGIPRMRQRPIGELVDLLRTAGANINYLKTDGFPPVQINADHLAGGKVHYGAARSSQFLSALLMVSPYARQAVAIDLAPGQTSWPYVAMTVQMMQQFGIACPIEHTGGQPRRIEIPRGIYAPRQYAIEPDASNAGYFLAAAAIHPGSKITIPGLGRASLQGDVGFADVLKQMGAAAIVGENSISITGPPRLNGIDVDLASMPDTAQTLAVTALFATGPTTIRGLHTLRVKETDRLAALSAELTKLGADVKINGDSLAIDPPKKVQPAEIETYDDHRMAMSFALATSKIAGITIKDAECVGKTYPNFFDDLRTALAST
jgi:3-phosphoshikimate 1-carboxyvinyltransferase